MTLNLSSNLIGNSNDEITFPHKILLNGTQVSEICKVFANGLSDDLKFSKTQLSKMIQSGGFLTDTFSVTSSLENIFKSPNLHLKWWIRIQMK